MLAIWSLHLIRLGGDSNWILPSYSLQIGFHANWDGTLREDSREIVWDNFQVPSARSTVNNPHKLAGNHRSFGISERIYVFFAESIEWLHTLWSMCWWRLDKTCLVLGKKVNRFEVQLTSLIVQHNSRPKWSVKHFSRWFRRAYTLPKQKAQRSFLCFLPSFTAIWTLNVCSSDNKTFSAVKFDSIAIFWANLKFLTISWYSFPVHHSLLDMIPQNLFSNPPLTVLKKTS